MKFPTYPLLLLDAVNKCISLTSKAKDILGSIEGECYLLSISGDAAIGKSSFLNVLLSLMQSLDEENSPDISQDKAIPYKLVYGIGDGNQSTTQGIDMYIQKFCGKTIIIMDIEGDNDPSRKDLGAWIYSNLIITAIGVSHFHCYHFPRIPQKSFFDYINSASKLVSQYNLHKDFIPFFYFFKRDYIYKNANQRQVDIKNIFKVIEKDIKDYYDDTSLNLLITPPAHLLGVEESESCILSQNEICNECLKDNYLLDILNFLGKLKNKTESLKPYQNGNALVDCLIKVLEINKRDLPFYLDAGSIAKFRMQKITQDRNRIFSLVNNLKSVMAHETLAQTIKKMLGDHPELFNVIDSNNDMMNSVQNIVNNVTFSVSRIDLLLYEIKKFTQDQLGDPLFSVLSEDEYDAFIQTYTRPLKENSGSIKSLIIDFGEIVNLVYKACEFIYKELDDAIKNFRTDDSSGQAKGYAAASAVATSVLIGYVAREAAVKVVAGLIGGGGVLGVALAAYSIYEAKKKFDKHKKDSMNKIQLSKIDSGHKYKEDLEIMKDALSFFGKILDEIDQRQKKLFELKDDIKCMNELSSKFEEVLKMKLNQMIEGKNISIKEELKVFVDLFDGVEKFSSNLKKCL